MNQLKNRDKGRFYVWVFKGDKGAMGMYQAAGYKIEEMSEDGVRPVGGVSVPNGQPIEFMDHVLMSVDNETQESIVREGMFGNGGLDMADERMRAIRKTGGAFEQAVHSTPYMTVEIDKAL